MKRPVLPKVLALSVATMLVVGTVSVNAYTNDTASTAAIPSVSGYSISNSNLDAQAKSDVKAKAQSVIKDTKSVDAKKSTSIVFDGSPVKKVEYDGEAHGLSAGAYPTLGGKRIADADMYYVGVQEDGTYYSSSKAPTEPGYYYVAATYPGSDDWYPIMAYGVVVITKKAPTPTVTPGPTDEPTVTPGPTDEPTVTPGPTDKPTVTPGPTDEPTVTPGPTDKPTVTPGPTDEPTVTPGPTDEPTVTPGPTDEPTVTPGPTDKPTVTPGPTDKPTVTPGPTDKPTTTPTTEPTKQPTSTPVNPTATPSTTATPTPTKKATATPTKKTTKTTKKTTAKKTTTNKKKAAKTGDATNFVVYIAGIAAAGAAITLTLRKRKH